MTGTDFNPAAGERNDSKDRASASVVYTKGPVRWLWATQYVGPAVFDLTDSPNTRDVRGIDAFWLFNTGLRYDFGKGVSVQLNVDNVLNEAPPFASMAGVAGVAGNPAVSTYFSGLLGRSYALTARVAF
ncbi:MAG: TonB-dependent receptor [Gammaproteobacteria bacterium]|nr:TonB-dependent receptor [Gammaproteobacteria bacterium]